ncbi:hypothetical protein NA57DRAFT_78687 [Rhizodiscina lignyota]|uniref:Heterokaryon incompatibility domain-containing protein n=1 Tax=Rhizodiscina lignyota TaxID=1504668 RepID=A0A9P4I9F8_9PEZI|nr:hypothetical protein NA57DRAFT_78687 [Rhizodiscina lignyota]
MKQIYEKAHGIAIWLGEPKGDTFDAFEYLRRWHNDPRSREQMDHSRGRQGLLELLRRSYWTRSWVLQEATTPKPQDRKIVLCGDLQAPLEYFFELTSSSNAEGDLDAGAYHNRHAPQHNFHNPMPKRKAILRELGRLLHLDLDSPLLDALLEKGLGPPQDTLRGRHAWRDMNLRQGFNPAAQSLFQSIYRRTNLDLASIIQDVYDVDLRADSSNLIPNQNLGADINILEAQCSATLSQLQRINVERTRSGDLARESTLYEPTYEKPAWVVYCEFAATLIERKRSLNILAYANQTDKPAHVLPSWVPDWTRKEVNGAVPLPRGDTPRWFTVHRNHELLSDPEQGKALKGRISQISRVLTPEEFQRLNPVDRPRLVESAIEIGILTLSEKPIINSPFEDLAEYFRGRRIFKLAANADSENNNPPLGIYDLSNEYYGLSILAPVTAEDGDRVFFVFGAQYPLILRKIRHPHVERFANSAAIHPDGLKEYSLRGEAVGRYVSLFQATNDVWKQKWESFHKTLTAFPWGFQKKIYKALLFKANAERYEAFLDQICEIALV